VNLELAAIDTLYRSRGIDPPVIERLARRGGTRRSS
jgi:hypothetical protein